MSVPSAPKQSPAAVATPDPLEDTPVPVDQERGAPDPEPERPRDAVRLDDASPDVGQERHAQSVAFSESPVRLRRLRADPEHTNTRIHGRVEIVAHQASAKVGFDRAGRNAVDADAARPEFPGHADRHHVSGGFRHGVDGEARIGDTRQAAADGDDRATVRHQGQQSLGEEEHAFDMQVHLLVELSLGGLAERGEEAVAGIVHQMVEALAAKCLLQRQAQSLREGGKFGDVGAVQLKGRGPASQCLDLGNGALREVLTAPIGDDDIAALARDVDGHVAAEAAARSGDDCNFCHVMSPSFDPAKGGRHRGIRVAGSLSLFA